MIIEKNPKHVHFSVVAPCHFDDALTPTELAAKLSRTTNLLVDQVNKNTQTIEDIVGGHTVNEINGIVPDQSGKVELDAGDIDYTSDITIEEALDSLVASDSNSVKTVNSKTPVDGAVTLSGVDIKATTSGEYYSGSDTIAQALFKLDTQIYANEDAIDAANAYKKFYFVNEPVPTAVSSGSIYLSNVQGDGLRIHDLLLGTNGYICEVTAVNSNSAMVQGTGAHLIKDTVNVLRYASYSGPTEEGVAQTLYVYYLNPSQHVNVGDYVVDKNGYIAQITAILENSTVEVTGTGKTIATASAGTVTSVNGEEPDSDGSVYVAPWNIDWQNSNQSRDEGNGTVDSALSYLSNRYALCMTSASVPTASTSISTPTSSCYPAPRYLDYVIGSNGYLGQCIGFTDDNTADIRGLGIAITTSTQVTGLNTRVSTLETKQAQNEVRLTVLMQRVKQATSDIDYDDFATTYNLENLCLQTHNSDIQIFVDDWDFFERLSQDVPAAALSYKACIRVDGTDSRNGLADMYSITLDSFSVGGGTPILVDSYKCIGYCTANDPDTVSFSPWKKVTLTNA